MTDIISLEKVLSDGNVHNALTLLSAATNRVKNDSCLSRDENTIESLVASNMKEFFSANLNDSNAQ